MRILVSAAIELPDDGTTEAGDINWVNRAYPIRQAVYNAAKTVTLFGPMSLIGVRVYEEVGPSVTCRFNGEDMPLQHFNADDIRDIEVWLDGTVEANTRTWGGDRWNIDFGNFTTALLWAQMQRLSCDLKVETEDGWGSVLHRKIMVGILSRYDGAEWVEISRKNADCWFEVGGNQDECADALNAQRRIDTYYSEEYGERFRGWYHRDNAYVVGEYTLRYDAIDLFW